MSNVSPLPESTAVAPDGFPLALAEMCQRLSADDKRLELIGAFYHDESQAGRLSDSESAYRQRYAAFATRQA